MFISRIRKNLYLSKFKVVVNNSDLLVFWILKNKNQNYNSLIEKFRQYNIHSFFFKQNIFFKIFLQNYDQKIHNYNLKNIIKTKCFFSYGNWKEITFSNFLVFLDEILYFCIICNKNLILNNARIFYIKKFLKKKKIKTTVYYSQILKSLILEFVLNLNVIFIIQKMFLYNILFFLYKRNNYTKI